MSIQKGDTKELIREVRDEEFREISDAKQSLLTKFNMLLGENHDFSGFPELEQYFSILQSNAIYEKHPLILFCIYKLSQKADNAKIKSFECDCCQGVTEFYRTVYDWLKDFVCETQKGTTGKYLLRHPEKNTLFKGDTMTSVFTPLKGYIKLKLGVQHTSSQTEDWEVYWLKHIWSIDLSKAAYDFIWYGYSPANFLPVSQGFNSGRSNFGKWDSWDLTLNQICQWYADNPQLNGLTNDCSLAEIFKHASNREDTVRHCTEWLKGFHSWENFIEQNHMQSFLLPDGRPKRFFENHTLEHALPDTTEDYEEFFENAVSCIEKRGDAMNRHLNTRQKRPEMA